MTYSQHALLFDERYWPDVGSTGQHLTDLAEHLAGAGWQVTVLCGRGDNWGAISRLRNARATLGRRCAASRIGSGRWTFTLESGTASASCQEDAWWLLRSTRPPSASKNPP